jgi:uncharacterized protein YkwD
MLHSSKMITAAMFVCMMAAVPVTADAASPTTLIRTQKRIERSAGGLRVQQHVRNRRAARSVPAIDARKQQRRPTPKTRKVSQRARRAQASDREIRERRLDRRTLRIEEATPIRTLSEEQELKSAVIRSVNREREDAGLPPLSPNAALSDSAQLYAEDMLRRGFFSHTSPEGEQPQERIKGAGFASVNSRTCECKGYYASFGENLAKGQQSVGTVVRDWMESPDHRKNILSPHFTDIGIGLAGYVWVQHFGSLQIDPR